MNIFQDQYSVSQLLAPHPARLGDPLITPVNVAVFGLVSDWILQRVVDANNGDQVGPIIIPYIQQYLNQAGWTVNDIGYDNDGTWDVIGFNIPWNCINGASESIQQNVRDGIFNAIQPVFYPTQNTPEYIRFDQDALNRCPASLGTGANADVVLHPTATGGTNNTQNTQQPSNPNSAKNWIDKNFFNGAGALTGVGIGALILVAAVVVMNKNK